MTEDKLQSLRILWCANSYWTSPFQVGANHYARALAKRGHRILFLSPALSPFHLFKKGASAELGDRLAIWREGGGTDIDGALTYYVPLTLLPHTNSLLLRERFTLEYWQELTLPRLSSKILAFGFDEPDLLVLDYAPYGYLLDALRPKRSIARVTDRLGAFSRSTPHLVAREHEILRRVDRVFYTAQTLEAEITALKPKAMTYLPNGADIAHFQQKAPLSPPEYAQIRAPRAVYVGAINEWFDVALLKGTAERLPEVSFVLIGPPSINLDVLRPLQNVHVLGRRTYADLPGYLHYADLGIIPFDDSPVTQSVSPIKLYEYMAAGLPVVSRRWAELEYVQSPALLCDGVDDFCAGVCTILEQPTPVEELHAFANKASWDQKATVLLDALGSFF